MLKYDTNKQKNKEGMNTFCTFTVTSFNVPFKHMFCLCKTSHTFKMLERGLEISQL